MYFKLIAEKSVVADHKAHEGKILLASMLTGYIGNTDYQIDLAFNKPVRVRVEPAIESDLIRVQDDWLDPVWNVTILDKDHPELPKEGLRSCWLHGTSYNYENGDIEPTREWVLETEWNDCQR